MPDPTTTDTTDRIATILTERYRLAPDTLVQLPIGQGTINYRATCADREVFVKNYPPQADLPGEREAIALSTLAGHHGVPVADVLLNRNGQVIDTSTDTAISVWEWIPGRVITKGLSQAHHTEAGQALGHIHAVFASLPASAGLAPQVTDWRTVDVPDLAARINRLLAIIAERTAAGKADTFDTQAAHTLTERRDMIHRIAELPELTAQVLHGDYSPVNLLFDGDRLAAVTDFRPPDPFLISYDLGRIAFYPTTDGGGTGGRLTAGIATSPSMSALAGSPPTWTP